MQQSHDGTGTDSLPSDASNEADGVLLAVPEPGVAEITLNRPATRNGLTLTMLQAMHAIVQRVADMDDIKAVVLSANGPVFSAGHDLKEITRHRVDADGGRSFYVEAMAACARLMQAIPACPKPVIAAVQGTATAAGCQLVATCDLAVAADDAQFCTPGVNIGLFCSTPMVALTRNVPRKRAMEMLLLGELISAADAAAWGLVNRVVAPDDLLPTARRLAADMASIPADTLQDYKKLIDAGFALAGGEARKLEGATTGARNAAVKPEEIEARRAAIQTRGRTQ